MKMMQKRLVENSIRQLLRPRRRSSPCSRLGKYLANSRWPGGGHCIFSYRPASPRIDFQLHHLLQSPIHRTLSAAVMMCPATSASRRESGETLRHHHSNFADVHGLFMLEDCCNKHLQHYLLLYPAQFRGSPALCRSPVLVSYDVMCPVLSRARDTHPN
jgi:hypothetical protein